MVTPQHLLTDDQMRQFITNGFLLLNVNMPQGFHEHIYQRCEAVYEKEGNPGNNILPRIPELQQVFDHPTVTGAFSSILGPDHVMHVHRHGHRTPAQGKGGGWHKDSYWGYKKIRHHHPRWAMVFYYPQAVSEENGATRVVPGSHCYSARFDNLDEQSVPVTGDAGVIAIVHFDIWHRAAPNMTDRNRYMMKFQFHRMSEPTAPAWNAQNTNWQPTDPKQDVVWKEHWNWATGRHTNSGTGDISSLIAQLSAETEPDRLNAAYTLGAIGESAVGALADTLTSDHEDARLAATYGLATTGKPAVDALIQALSHNNEQIRAHAAFALGDMGSLAEDAVQTLAQTLKDTSPWVRHHAAEALGTIVQKHDIAVPALAQTLKDDDSQVRYNAAYSLARFGSQAAEAVPALVQALQDENRYTSGHAVAALRRIRTPEAIDTLLHWMEVTRWCPFTTKDSTF